MDRPVLRRHAHGRCPMDLHCAMAQLESDMDHTAGIRHHRWYRGSDRREHRGRIVSPSTSDVIAGRANWSRLGGVYQSGYFKMSTWIPFVWALISALVLILSSFAIHGGL